MASSDLPKPEPAIFTNHVTTPLSSELLDSKNYAAWASNVCLWLVGQDYEDHLTKQASDIDATNRSRWKKIDAQLCCILRATIHPSVKPVFRAHESCAAIWAQAQSLFTNNT